MGYSTLFRNGKFPEHGGYIKYSMKLLQDIHATVSRSDVKPIINFE